MNPNIKVSSIDHSAKLRASLASLGRKRVLVGVPEEKNDRRSGEITNAGLVYLHTHGSALQHIPPRPIIEPAIEAADNKAMITAKLGEAAKSALNGQAPQTTQALNQAGMLGRNAAIRWFTDPRNHWAANSPRTVAEKGSDRPLIDTAQMRRSITYVVDENK
jgi:hypothetical protein